MHHINQYIVCMFNQCDFPKVKCCSHSPGAPGVRDTQQYDDTLLYLPKYQVYSYSEIIFCQKSILTGFLNLSIFDKLFKIVIDNT